jgi:hypothetical protein
MDLSPETLQAEAARMEAQAPGYLTRVRRSAAALARPASERDRVARAIALTVEAAQVTPNVPLASNRRAGRLMKRVVAAVTRFYFLSLTAQVVEFAESSAWMGQALLDYTASLEAEVADLKERVRCLEQGPGAP